MILMSVADKKLLQTTPRSLQSDQSILSWFLANNDFITSADQIKDLNEVEGIYPTVANISDPIKTGNGNAGFTVIANDVNNIRVREPFPYMHLPVQLKGLEFEINCYGRFAGIETVYPAAIEHWLGV